MGGFGLPVEDVRDERILPVPNRRQSGAEALLVPGSGVRDRAERLAARTPRAVAGPDAQIVRQLENTERRGVEAACRGLHLPRVARSRFEEVGATQITHEDEIPRDHPHGLAGTGTTVRDQEAHVLRRVAGGVHGLKIDLAHGEEVAVPEQGDPVAALRPFVLPARASLGGEVRAAAVPVHELAAPRQEVGVDVGLGHGRDPESLPPRNRHVPVHVPFGVDQHGLPGALAPDEVRVLGQFAVDDLPEEHLRFPNGLGALPVNDPNGEAKARSGKTNHHKRET